MMMSIGVASGRMVPSTSSTSEDLLEKVPDLGLKRDDFPVTDDGAAVHGKDQLIACRDRLFEELLDCLGAGASLSAAARACRRTSWKERNVRAVRRAGRVG